MARPPRKKRQPSSIDRLEPELQEALAALRRQGKTVTEIHAGLVAMGAEVSRSAVGRHVKSMAEVGEELKKTEAMARFLVEEFGENPDERMARASMRILQGGILRLLTERPVGEDGAVIEIDAGEAKELALALQRVVNSQATDTSRNLRVRREVVATAADEAEKAMKERGMSADTIADIRRAVLGAAG
ncbi:DUF3486 family protein [Caulobacter sp. SLTY]|uniref:phage protein Gp27 family protein n=1 Tax=Caulobacter sp. SLTY TaxID=2683262 RepID=UPI00141374A1|nr:phage protein Gp27 family protein [Caulobacter sp. SLTY]NBB17033.1 DUF3486 family protein [Caulobacter sp. SLTY]